MPLIFQENNDIFFITYNFYVTVQTIVKTDEI